MNDFTINPYAFGGGGGGGTNITVVTTITDNAPTGGGNPKTITGMSFGAAASDRDLIITLVGERGAGGLTTATALTLDGNSATEVINVGHSGGGRSGHSAIWAIAAGTGDGLDGVTSGDVVITGDDTATWICTIYNITGLNSLTAHDTATGTSTTAPNGSLDCNANGIIIGVTGASDGSDGASTTSYTNLATEDNDSTHDGGKLSSASAHEIFTSAQTGLSITGTLAVTADSASIALASFDSS